MSAAVTRTIAWYELLSNTASGNPRYRVHFEGEPSAITSSDAAFCYAVGNPGMRSGDTVSVTYTRAGHIAHMEAAPTPGCQLYTRWQESAERGDCIVSDWTELRPDEQRAWDYLARQWDGAGKVHEDTLAPIGRESDR